MLRLVPSLLIFLVAGCADVDTQRPSLRVLSPADAGEGPADLAVRLSARVDDGEASLVQVAVTVRSDVDGRLCKRAPGTKGEVVCSAVLTEGEHLLTFVAEDAAGNKRERSITWTATAAAEVDLDGDGVLASEGDCDDSDATISPLAEEIANGIDDNCDGRVDEGTSIYDDDGDGYSEVDGDCDDADPAAAPDRVEVDDGIDNDCDGEVDEPDGAWSGTLDLVMDGGLVSTCAGLIDLDIDRSADPAILGTATCESADAALTALSLSGAVDAFGLWSGTLSLLLDGEGPFSLDWTAGPGTTGVDGVVIGAATTTAYGEVQLSGSFAVER